MLWNRDKLQSKGLLALYSDYSDVAFFTLPRLSQGSLGSTERETLWIRENLVMTWACNRTPTVLPPTTCKLMSNVTIHLSKILTLACLLCKPFVWGLIDSCQNKASADKYHMTIQGSDERPILLPLHVSHILLSTWMNEWMNEKSWMKGQLKIHFNMWTVSSDVSIQRPGAPNGNFWKISVRKTIWDLEFSKHLL